MTVLKTREDPAGESPVEASIQLIGLLGGILLRSRLYAPAPTVNYIALHTGVYTMF